MNSSSFGAHAGTAETPANWYTVRVNRFAKVLGLLILVSGVASAFSASVVGKWNGRLVATFTPPPTQKGLSADQIKHANVVLASIRIILTIKADGTYAAVTKGSEQEDKKSTGKWTLKGKRLTLLRDEKGASPEVGNLSADGKSLKMSLPKDMTAFGVNGSAVFKKA